MVLFNDSVEQINLRGILYEEVFYLKLTVLYFSKTGSTRLMAEAIVKGMMSVGDV